MGVIGNESKGIRPGSAGAGDGPGDDSRGGSGGVAECGGGRGDRSFAPGSEGDSFG
jgi:hypothetical protein